jgi:hypothetical protein
VNSAQWLVLSSWLLCLSLCICSAQLYIRCAVVKAEGTAARGGPVRLYALLRRSASRVGCLAVCADTIVSSWPCVCQQGLLLLSCCSVFSKAAAAVVQQDAGLCCYVVAFVGVHAVRLARALEGAVLHCRRFLQDSLVQLAVVQENTFASQFVAVLQGEVVQAGRLSSRV